MRLPKLTPKKKSPVDSHRKRLKARDGALVMRAKRVSLGILLTFLLLMAAGVGLMLLGFGIPGRAWM